MSDTVSIRELLGRTADVIGSRHEARWLCEVAVGLDGDELDAVLDEPATVRTVAHLDAMVARYRSGEPLQYVLGRWSFRHLDLAVDRRVLIPRPETEFVAGLAVDVAKRVAGPRTVADLGTGSGAIGLSLAVELPVADTVVWLTDISDDALAVARANLAGIGSAGVNVRIAAGPWFAALPPDLRCDLIVSNPPYVAVNAPELDDSVLHWEPGSALFSGADGLDDLRLLIAGAPEFLTVDGHLVLEIGADQGGAVLDLLVAHGYRDAVIQPDLAGLDRAAVARRPS